MKNVISSCLAAGSLAIMLNACGSSMPPPSDRLASAEAAARSARELGAEKVPNAALELKLASEQIDQAKALMKDNDNKRADMILQRASADAELAVMFAKQKNAEDDAATAQDKVKSLNKGGK